MDTTGHGNGGAAVIGMSRRPQRSERSTVVIHQPRKNKRGRTPFTPRFTLVLGCLLLSFQFSVHPDFSWRTFRCLGQQITNSPQTWAQGISHVPALDRPQRRQEKPRSTIAGSAGKSNKVKQQVLQAQQNVLQEACQSE